MPCIDLIIPIYNGEKYIPNLIQCLNNQTMKDFRAVFVDDGSTDNTYQQLQEQLKSASFLYLLIHQENKGLPGARNTGIRNAEADWIAFMDSDDGLDSRFLEFLHRGVSESGANVGVCEYQIITGKNDVQEVNPDEFAVRVISSCESLKSYYTSWFGAGALILRRKWLQDQKILFDEACTYLEDVPFITQVIVCADQVAFVNCPLYLYYMREGSLMHSPKIEKYQIALAGFERMAQKVASYHNESSAVFQSMGRARYYVATLRKGAVLMPYDKFKQLCDCVPLKQVEYQVMNLQPKFRLAAKLYLRSKPLFYCAMRLLSKD